MNGVKRRRTVQIAQHRGEEALRKRLIRQINHVGNICEIKSTFGVKNRTVAQTIVETDHFDRYILAPNQNTSIQNVWMFLEKRLSINEKQISKKPHVRTEMYGEKRTQNSLNKHDSSNL